MSVSVLGEVKPWQTETPGERLFLLAYDLAKAGVPTSLAEQPWMVSGQGLSEFLRLVVAMELTHRCLNASVEVIEANPGVSSDAVMRELRRSVQLYGPNHVLKLVAEQSRLAALAYVERNLTVGRKNATHREERHYCCWCGTHTSRTSSGSQKDQSTVEHIWPEFLGGTSIAENLTIACKECNSARQHAFTWAWFGLQAYNEKIDANGRLPRRIYLGLALHRLIRVASGQTKLAKGPISLKSATKILKGAIPEIKLHKDRRYTFFEILQLSTE